MFTESQNYFQLELRDGILLAGKPDLVTLDPAGLVAVREAKTGKPQNSHLLQTMIYMWALPLALPRYSGQKLMGRVIYKNGDDVPIPPNAIDADFEDTLRYFVEQLAATAPPPCEPSTME